MRLAWTDRLALGGGFTDAELGRWANRLAQDGQNGCESILSLLLHHSSQKHGW
ncbi:MAG TPA: hypothetical protein VKT82_14725 [Ktedonobacterales bacterium]|nr:hypothetical protein [Ktedonobacterales bacterium]